MASAVAFFLKANGRLIESLFGANLPGCNMTNRLSRMQAVMLGTLAIFVFLLGGAGLAALAAKDRLWADTLEVTILLPDAGDLPPGTPVRVRGLEAGHVQRVEDPTDDAPDSVRLIVRLDGRYRNRLYNDAFVQVQTIGLLGSKVIAISPGSANTGVHASHVLIAKPQQDLAAVADKLASVADEAKALLKEARSGSGTLAKLIRDDGLYNKMQDAVTQMEQEAGKLSGLVADGRDTLRSVRQSTDAVQRMPIIRSYVENTTALLIRPDCRRELYSYDPRDLFEPGTAILHEAGRQHLAALSGTLRASDTKTEIVVAVACDSALTSAAAEEVTRKQAQVVADALKNCGAHKTSLFSRNRPITPIGLGTDTSLLGDTVGSSAQVQVITFVPIH